jgi:hypothetical protein
LYVMRRESRLGRLTAGCWTCAVRS